MKLLGLLAMFFIVLLFFEDITKICSLELITSPSVINSMPSQPDFHSISPMTVLTTFVVPILFGFIIIVGLVGNGLVIFVIFQNSHMINSTNILISSLALADLTFIIFCIPLTMDIYIRMGWIWGGVLCMGYQYLTSLTVYCSVYTLVLMSIDRYLAVVHPHFSGKWRTKNCSLAAVYILWTALIVLNLPFLFYSGVVHNPIPQTGNNQTKKRFFCTFKRLVYFNKSQNGYVDNSVTMGYHYFCFFLFAFLVPLAIIIILYCLLLCRISKRFKNHQSSNMVRCNQKATRLVVSVIIAFAISWLPIHIVFLIQATLGDPKNVGFRSFHMIANSMAYGNSMINPILYAFLSENFRKGFRRFFSLRFLHYRNSMENLRHKDSVQKSPEIIVNFNVK